MDPLTALEEEVTTCRRCPRLVAWREQVAHDKRAAFRDEEYWGRPVPGFGDHGARVLVVGLAPAAHGANRTGRMFTGDRSGEWLYRALWRAGFANQPVSVARDDGLRLDALYITAPVKCAPPANRPTPEERDSCHPWLKAEWAALEDVRVVLALGAFGFREAARLLGLSPVPAFGHGVEVPVQEGRTLLGCYHVSQQNTFTGKLTEQMLDDVVHRARELADLGPPAQDPGRKRGP